MPIPDFIVEPGENPANCAVREVLEESGVHAAARRLAWVHVSNPVVHVNGDHARYLDHVFRMDWVADGSHSHPTTTQASQRCSTWSSRPRWRELTILITAASGTPAAHSGRWRARRR